MADQGSSSRGFIAAVVVFWFLAAAGAGVTFVFLQLTEQAKVHAEQLEAEARRVADARVKTDAAVVALRNALDAGAAADADAVQTVRAKIGDAPHAAAAFLNADQTASSLQSEISTLELRKAAREQQLSTFRAEQTAAEAAFAAQLKDVDERAAAVTQQINTRLNALTGQLTALTKRTEDLDTQIAADRDGMLKERVDYDRNRQLFLGQRDNIKNELRINVEFRPIPVGRVLAANMALNYAFIDLGTKQGVVEGMRFSIYGPDTVFHPGLKPKGVIEVKRAEDDRSQCQVIHQNLSDPVVTNDVLVNVAFDPTGRKPTFVLVGFLDLTGTRVDARDQIVTIIRLQGGEVLPPDPSYVDVNTDFLLVGADWNRGDSKERLLWERDQAITDKALKRSVTQLDLDTFLNYIGYPKWK
jgi:hypothetical protein